MYSLEKERSTQKIGGNFLNIFERAITSIRGLFSRSAMRDPDSWFTKIFSEARSSNSRALKVATVYACNKVLAETIATLPKKCYERTPDGGKEEYSTYFLQKLFKKPNKLQTEPEFFETMVTHINMRGNHYAGINFDRGYPSELITMNPLMMLPEIKNNEFLYGYTHQTGPVTVDETLVYPYVEKKNNIKYYKPWEILHNKNLTINGILGLSPISYMKKTIELSLESEDHGYRYFKNGSRVSGFLKHPGELSDKAYERLKKSWKKRTTGENKFSLEILEEGMDFAAAALSNEDSQYLQTRQFQVEDAARWYRVPLELIGHPAKTASYASVEQFILSFVIHTIRPWLVKIENRVNTTLIPEEDQDRIFWEFKIDGLLRGDIMTRYKAYAVGRQWGWLCADDIRGFENMNPLPDGKGKIYLMPLNMEDIENPRKRKGE